MLQDNHPMLKWYIGCNDKLRLDRVEINESGYGIGEISKFSVGTASYVILKK